MRYKRLGCLRRGGPNEARPPTLAGVGVERELRDDNRLPPDIDDRKVGLPFFVLKDSQSGAFLGQPFGFCRCVVMADPDEDDEPPVDLSQRFLPHPHFPPPDSLQHNPHLEASTGRAATPSRQSVRRSRRGWHAVPSSTWSRSASHRE